MGILIMLCLIILFHLIGMVEAQRNPIFINCGSNSTIDVGGRRWVGDLAADSNATLSSPGFSASVPEVDGGLVLASLYRTARVFNTTSNYSFAVPAGSYYVRLHFYPSSLKDLDVDNSVFDVTANGVRLLTRYNVNEEIARKNSYLNRLGSNSSFKAMVKEYYLNISFGELWIHIVPVSTSSFAYINAIEVLPILDSSFFDYATKVGGERNPLNLIDGGMETMYRINMGDREIGFDQDKDLWRSWESDIKYMFSSSVSSTADNTSQISYADGNHSSIAPLQIYEDARVMPDNGVVEKKFNMTWNFSIDPDFEYLVRMHFCELHFETSNQRVFRIYINFRTAADNYDVFLRAEGKNKAYHEDFVDMVTEQDMLWLQLGQDAATSALGTDGLLNGLEIFKISKNGNLAHVSERIETRSGGVQKKKSKSMTLWIEVCAGSASVVVISVLCLLFFCNYKKEKATVKSCPPSWHPLALHGTLESTTNACDIKLPPNANGTMASSRIGRRFTMIEIRNATENFDNSLIIGTGGFGNVYKGELEDGDLVAIKRAHPNSDQGLAEFETEIETLSKLRHRHLVSLVGYCDEKNEMILVYEYMANGTLRSHLYGNNLPPLSWRQRLDACIGAARGLHYLHTGADRGIIHRDIKTTNILLDGNLVAKMADFGLSKTGPMLDHTHVSTAVKGSFGYLDPEYFRRQQLTQKSDVYSFGVVLFEVVCARPVINPTLPKDQINLAEWAARWQQQGSLETIVDPQLKGSYSLESLNKFGEIALKCLSDQGKSRPTIGEVLWHLEYALQLHEAYTRSSDADSFPSSELGLDDLAFSLPMIKEGEESAYTEKEYRKEHYVEKQCEGQSSRERS